MLRRSVAAFILIAGTLVVNPGAVSAAETASNEPGWLGVVVARGALKEWIDSTPIVERPTGRSIFMETPCGASITVATPFPGPTTLLKAARRWFPRASRSECPAVSFASRPRPGVPGARPHRFPTKGFPNPPRPGARPRRDHAQPRVVRGLSTGGAPAAARVARPVGVAARAVLRAADAGTVGCRPSAACQDRRRRSAGPGLCAQRHGGRQQRAPFAAFSRRRRNPRDRPRLQRLQQCRGSWPKKARRRLSLRKSPCRSNRRSRSSTWSCRTLPRGRGLRCWTTSAVRRQLSFRSKNWFNGSIARGSKA